MLVPIKQIDATKENNVRSELGDLNELYESVALKGILDPITVSKVGDTYRIVDGFRRFDAAKKAGLKEVPVNEVAWRGETDYISNQLILNLQRKSINPVDEGVAFQKLLDSGMKVEDIAKTVSQSMSYIQTRVNITTYSKIIQDSVKESPAKLWPTHAREIARLPLDFHQEFIDKYGLGPIQKLRKAVEKKLSALNKATLGADSTMEDAEVAAEDEGSLLRGQIKEKLISLCSVFRPKIVDDARVANFTPLDDNTSEVLHKILMMIPTDPEDLRIIAEKIEDGIIGKEDEPRKKVEFVFHGGIGGAAESAFRELQSKISDNTTLMNLPDAILKAARHAGSRMIRVEDVKTIADVYGIQIGKNKKES